MLIKPLVTVRIITMKNIILMTVKLLKMELNNDVGGWSLMLIIIGKLRI